jgi:Mn2+/Fe2+ NRAMP family transporter
MRFLLFLAALGIVSQGIKLSSTNPAASVFEAAAGNLGYKFFGIVIWSAAITSVVGASFTSVSFWKTLAPFVKNKEKIIISAFIILSTIIFIAVGNPVKLLVMAGAVNGIILPIALAVILIAANKTRIVQQYKHPVSLQIAGWLVVLAMSYMSVIVIRDAISKL